MPDHSGQRLMRASHCLEQAKQAMQMADQAESRELREELLALAMSWLKLAYELEHT
jgi:hypothetical protein